MPDNTYNDYGTPLTRAEAYLAQIAQNTDGDGSAEGIGNTYNDYGTPLTRAEALLATIMENTAGGGGGGSGGGVLVVNLTLDMNTGVMVFDKTWSEVNAAPAAVACLDNSALGGTGAWRMTIGSTDAVGNGDGSFTYRVLAMQAYEDSDGFVVGCVPFTTNSTDGYPSIQMG